MSLQVVCGAGSGTELYDDTYALLYLVRRRRRGCFRKKDCIYVVHIQDDLKDVSEVSLRSERKRKRKECSKGSSRPSYTLTVLETSSLLHNT